MYAVFGPVEFELITYFDGMEASFGVDYAEHALIGRKSRLQWVGEKLDELRIDLVFHAAYCDPEAEFLKLRQAMQSREAGQFVLGSGEYKGWFVVTDLTLTSRQTDKEGRLIEVAASMTLREYVIPDLIEMKKARGKKQAAARRASAKKKKK